MSDERSEVWGSMFGISKGRNITDQEESSFKSPYNPDGLTAEEWFNPAQCDKEKGRQTLSVKLDQIKTSLLLTDQIS